MPTTENKPLLLNDAKAKSKNLGFGGWESTGALWHKCFHGVIRVADSLLDLMEFQGGQEAEAELCSRQSCEVLVNKCKISTQ